MESEYSEQRIIKDIENNDTSIQITGYVNKVLEKDLIIIDDKSGTIKVNTKEVEYKLKVKDLINVIGNLEISMSGEKIIQARIIQDMSNLNFGYYKKLYEMKKSLE